MAQLGEEVSAREVRSREFTRRAAAEGIVLLENDGVLPLGSEKVALYGGGALYTVKGGTGSGSVNNRGDVNIAQGLRDSGITLTDEDWLTEYEQIYNKVYAEWKDSVYAGSEPGVPMSLYRSYAVNRLVMPRGGEIRKTDTDTAIYVVSRISGEGADRTDSKGDYYLSDVEEEELAAVTAVYPRTVVILNIGGVMDMSFLERYQISAVVLMFQAGMEGGHSLADVLTGKVNPSGRLTDTWAYKYSDYPSSENFGQNNGDLHDEFYTEGVYVGYRYFDAWNVPVRYPFGYGMSYTTFEYEIAEVDTEKCEISVRVRNTGSVPGKQVIQYYAACPHLRAYGGELKRLIGYGKTGLLAPGEEQVLSFRVLPEQLEDYDPHESKWKVAEGDHLILVGTSAKEYKAAAVVRVSDEFAVQKVKAVCELKSALKEIRPDAKVYAGLRKVLEEMCKDSPVLNFSAEQMKEAEACSAEESAVDVQVRDFLGKLTVAEKASICCGRVKAGEAEIIGNAASTVQGAAGETCRLVSEFAGRGLIMADGPAGLRLAQTYEEDPETGKILEMSFYQSLENRFFKTEFFHEGTIRHHQYCSAIPVGTLLAQTFDTELIKEAGKVIAVEMQEMGVNLWLAPGMNIHRNPMCGRNYEYYSEDPVVAGTMAAAMTEGVQSMPGCGVTIKHYACNNQEENRRGVDSIVSERALRQIYLKGYEIAVRSSKPTAVMTAYNKINGTHCSNSYELCTQVLRNEWGFDGIVMTDWTTTNTDGGASAAKCVRAGNDLTMPGQNSDILEITQAVEGGNDQYLDEADLDLSCGRILKMALRLQA